MQVTASVQVIEEISSVPTTTILTPILYEPTLWETLTTFIQNVINLI